MMCILHPCKGLIYGRNTVVLVVVAAIEFEDWYLLTNTNGNHIGLKNQVV